MITIIILVILAGVTIATLKNTNLFNNALKAKEKSDYASAKEAIEIKLSAINADYEMHGNGESKLQFTAERLDPEKDSDIEYVRAEYEEEASIQGLKTGKDITKIYTTLKKYEDYEFAIDSNIKIASINRKAVSKNNEIALTGSISFEKDLLKPNGTTTATVTVANNKSEINYTSSKYVLTNSDSSIGTDDETKYSGGTLSSTGTASITAGSTEGDYYLHVLLKDNAGNKSEIVSGKLEVSAITYNYTATGMVEYDAGSWTKEEIDELNSLNLYNINRAKTANTALSFKFGGFTYRGDTTNASYVTNGTITTSRNKSIAPESLYGIPTSDGWVVFEWGKTSGTKKYVKKLISAGSPENFVYYYNTSKDSYRAEYILSGGVRQKTNAMATDKPRNFDMYKDKSKIDMIREVHCMIYEEASANDKITVKTGGWYWLANANYNDIWFTDGENGGLIKGKNACWGIRPVITLNQGVYIDTKKHSGTGSDKYILEMDKEDEDNKTESSEGDTIKVGDVIKYTPSEDSNFTVPEYKGVNDGSVKTLSTENLTWKVWKKTSDSILITTTTPTSGIIKLYGEDGYDNGVQALNAYCKKYYSDTANEITARNINIDDLEDSMTKAGKTAKNGYSNYELLVEPSYSNCYPALYSQEEPTPACSLDLSDWPNSDKGYDKYEPSIHYSNGNTKYPSGYKQTFYKFNIADLTSKKYYDDKTLELLFSETGYGSGYWVASRCVNVFDSVAWFGIRMVTNSGLGNPGLESSQGFESPQEFSLRPVVCIPKSKISTYVK